MQEKSIKKSPIKGRILQYLEKEGVSKYAFYQATGISKGTLDNDSGLTEENLMRVLDYAPNISLEWLINGSTPIIRGVKSPINMIEEGDISYSAVSRDKQVDGRKGIPLIPTDAFAGNSGGDVSISERDIKEYYVVPDFGDADYMIKVKGDSMTPTYRNGDVVALKLMRERGFTQWNRVHVVATPQGVVIKRLHPGETPDVLLAHSDNPDYPPFKIPTDSITNIALVVGVIRPE
jgi:SOS-response transcriptional repressor LexA